MNTFLQCFTTFLYQVDVVCKSQVVYSLSLNRNSCPIILDAIHHSFQICNKYIWRYWITLPCSYCSWKPFSYFLSKFYLALLSQTLFGNPQNNSTQVDFSFLLFLLLTLALRFVAPYSCLS